MSAHPGTFRVGAAVQCVYAFRNPTTRAVELPTAVTVEPYGPAGTLAEAAFDETDPRVYLGDYTDLSADAVDALLDDDEVAAGDATKLVVVIVTPDAAGRWRVNCADGTETGNETVTFNARARNR